MNACFTCKRLECDNIDCFTCKNYDAYTKADWLIQLESEIRADERRKFAEWLTKSKYGVIEPFGFKKYFFDNTRFSIDVVMAEYEKQKGGGNA